ncbi:uncharacterized protein LOC131522011 isoform X2 [Onychostoma macrolepis]|uniref:uncharacterized protein LOC131522011 isoform X2 n=1 Tax=Onychostoma macrolepis TaxID=369639 RepID=UPI00272DB128|nr:uncharacterized protein LOC131522011 isoform X2 [Onychostoma macrolepis]
MRSFQFSFFQLLYLLIAGLLQCKAQTQRSCKQFHQTDINYVQGDSMTISCLTTIHSLESLTVKLRKKNQDKDILMYPDISPGSEHQRWSVRKEAGNVTLDLKDIRLSDDGFYDCRVYKDQDCLHSTPFNLKVRECKLLNPVHAKINSSALLPCSEQPLQNRTEQVTWEIITGHQSTNITQYHHPNKPSNSTERLLKPLFERARKIANGSLNIRDAVHADESWYRCRVNEKTCYEVKLLMKDYGTSNLMTILETPPTTLLATASADNSFGQAESNTTNSTVVVMTTILSLCVLISLTVCVFIYFKKQKCKSNSQTQLNDQFSVYYSHVADEFDVPFYSLVERNTATMTTFVAEKSEAPAFKPDDLYEKLTL